MLTWGFGIEKEFPILIGTYYKNDLIKYSLLAIRYYEKHFLTHTSHLSPRLHTYFKSIHETLQDNINSTKKMFDRDNNFYINLKEVY